MVDVAHKHHVAVMQQLHEAPVSRYWLMQEIEASLPVRPLMAAD